MTAFDPHMNPDFTSDNNLMELFRNGKHIGTFKLDADGDVTAPIPPLVRGPIQMAIDECSDTCVIGSDRYQWELIYDPHPDHCSDSEWSD